MPGDKVQGKDPFEIKTAAKIEEKKAEVTKRQPAVQSKPTIRKIAPMELIERTLRNHSYKGNYAEALEVFDSILAHEHLSPAEKSAVHFYMGQCEFYLGKYKKAIRSFILSKEDPRRRGQAESWIVRCLERVN